MSYDIDISRYASDSDFGKNEDSENQNTKPEKDPTLDRNKPHTWNIHGVSYDIHISQYASDMVTSRKMKSQNNNTKPVKGPTLERNKKCTCLILNEVETLIRKTGIIHFLRADHAAIAAFF